MTNKTSARLSEIALGQCPLHEVLEKSDNDSTLFYAKQTLAYVMQLRRIFGHEPTGSCLCMMADVNHENHIAKFRYDPLNGLHGVYSAKLSKLPKNWDDMAINMIDHWRGKYREGEE